MARRDDDISWLQMIVFFGAFAVALGLTFISKNSPLTAGLGIGLILVTAEESVFVVVANIVKEGGKAMAGTNVAFSLLRIIFLGGAFGLALWQIATSNSPLTLTAGLGIGLMLATQGLFLTVTSRYLKVTSK